MANEATAASSGTSALGAGAISAGIQAGSSLIGGLVNQAFAKRNAAMQFKNWKKAFDYEAAYNSPKNQLNRLYEAGINPLFDSQFGGQIQGGMSTGSLPESIDAPDLGKSFSDALAAFGLALQERQTKVEEKRAGLEEIHTQDEHNKAVEEVRVLQQKQELNEEEKKRLQALTASINASTKQSWIELKDKMLNTQLRMFETFNTARQKDYALKLQEQSNATDRWNASTNFLNYKMEKDKYDKYYSREIAIDEGRLQNERDRIYNETRKLTHEQFVEWFNKYEKRIGIKTKGISLSTPTLNTQQATTAALSILALGEVIADRMSNTSPYQPAYIQLNELNNRLREQAEKMSKPQLPTTLPPWKPYVGSRQPLQ